MRVYARTSRRPRSGAPGERRAFEPGAMEGTPETDSEEEGFEPSVPPPKEAALSRRASG